MCYHHNDVMLLNIDTHFISLNHWSTNLSAASLKAMARISPDLFTNSTLITFPDPHELL